LRWHVICLPMQPPRGLSVGRLRFLLCIESSVKQGYADIGRVDTVVEVPQFVSILLAHVSLQMVCYPLSP